MLNKVQDNFMPGAHALPLSVFIINAAYSSLIIKSGIYQKYMLKLFSANLSIFGHEINADNKLISQTTTPVLYQRQ